MKNLFKFVVLLMFLFTLTACGRMGDLTPIGKIQAPKDLEYKKVEVHIRPQGVKLIQESTPVNGIKGTVMASRLMGEYSFVHLSVLNENNDIVHVHSHMPASFYPDQSSAVGIEIEKEQTFIFPI